MISQTKPPLMELCNVVYLLSSAFVFSCWLSLERGFIWSFVGPVLLVLAVSSYVKTVFCKHLKFGFYVSKYCKLAQWLYCKN